MDYGNKGFGAEAMRQKSEMVPQDWKDRVEKTVRVAATAGRRFTTVALKGSGNRAGLVKWLCSLGFEANTYDDQRDRESGVTVRW